MAELIIEDIMVADGKIAEQGDRLTVHYSGWLSNGKPFDSSKERNIPFDFQLGVGDVIPGWDQGVEGMTVGSVRKLTIPSDLAYGPIGAGNVIPPNATLTFEIELLAVRKKDE